MASIDPISLALVATTLSWLRATVAGGLIEIGLERGLARLEERGRVASLIARLDQSGYGGVRVPSSAIRSWLNDPQVANLLNVTEAEDQGTEDALAGQLVEILISYWAPSENEIEAGADDRACEVVTALLIELARDRWPAKVLGRLNKIQAEISGQSAIVNDALRQRPAWASGLIGTVREIDDGIHQLGLDVRVVKELNSLANKHQIAILRDIQTSLRHERGVSQKLLEILSRPTLRIAHLRSFLAAVVEAGTSLPLWWPIAGPSPHEVHIPVRAHPAGPGQITLASVEDGEWFVPKVDERARSKSVGIQDWAEASVHWRIAIVFGVPGAGKTWLARYEAVESASKALDALAELSDGMPLAEVDLDSLDIEIPLWVTADRLSDLQGTNPWQGFVNAAFTALSFDGELALEHGPLSDWLARQAASESGRWRVIIDAVDEASQAEHIASIIPKALYRRQDVTVRLLSRPSGFHPHLSPTEVANTAEVELCQFDYPDDVHHLIDSWYPERDRLKRRDLKDRLDESGSLQQLSRTPLFATWLCIIHGSEQSTGSMLPQTRAAVIDSLIGRLLTGEHRPPRSRHPISERSRFDAAAELAWTMATTPSGWQVEIDLGERHHGAADLADAVDDLLISTGPNHRRWLHKTIQEFLCAQHLANRSRDIGWESIQVELFGDVEHAPRVWDFANWSETVSYLGHTLSSECLEFLFATLLARDIGGYLWPLQASLVSSESNTSRYRSQLASDVFKLAVAGINLEHISTVVDRCPDLAYELDAQLRSRVSTLVGSGEHRVGYDDREIVTAIRIFSGEDLLTSLASHPNDQVRFEIAMRTKSHDLLNFLCSDRDPAIRGIAKVRSGEEIDAFAEFERFPELARFVSETSDLWQKLALHPNPDVRINVARYTRSKADLVRLVDDESPDVRTIAIDRVWDQGLLSRFRSHPDPEVRRTVAERSQSDDVLLALLHDSYSLVGAIAARRLGHREMLEKFATYSDPEVRSIAIHEFGIDSRKTERMSGETRDLGGGWRSHMGEDMRDQYFDARYSDDPTRLSILVATSGLREIQDLAAGRLASEGIDPILSLPQLIEASEPQGFVKLAPQWLRSYPARQTMEELENSGMGLAAHFLSLTHDVSLDLSQASTPWPHVGPDPRTTGEYSTQPQSELFRDALRDYLRDGQRLSSLG